MVDFEVHQAEELAGEFAKNAGAPQPEEGFRCCQRIKDGLVFNAPQETAT